MDFMEFINALFELTMVKKKNFVIMSPAVSSVSYFVHKLFLAYKCKLPATVPIVASSRIEIRGPAPIVRVKMKDKEKFTASFSYVVSKGRYPNDTNTKVDSLEKATHYLIDTAKFSKAKGKNRCTAKAEGTRNACNSKIIEAEKVRMLATFTPHKCIHKQE